MSESLNKKYRKKKSNAILVIKSFIYRYLGVYLAHKEELEYITSKEYWKDFSKSALNAEKNELSLRDLQGLMIGTWQMNHGFTRFSGNLEFCFSDYKLHRLINWFLIFGQTLQDDVLQFIGSFMEEK